MPFLSTQVIIVPMSAAPISHANGVIEKSFFDEHFIQIAFAASTLALFILSPLSLILGMGAGIALHRYVEPDLKFQDGEKIISVSNALFIIVGATAAFVGLLPLSPFGGPIIRLLPLIAAGAIGSTAYRAFRSI